MINKHPSFEGLDIRIPIIIPIRGRGFVNQGSTLGFRDYIRAYGFGSRLRNGPCEKRLDENYRTHGSIERLVLTLLQKLVQAVCKNPSA